MTADLTKKWGANDCENSIVKYGTFKNMFFKKDRSALVLLHLNTKSFMCYSTTMRQVQYEWKKHIVPLTRYSLFESDTPAKRLNLKEAPREAQRPQTPRAP
jgi:hypothetical protein